MKINYFLLIITTLTLLTTQASIAQSKEILDSGNQNIERLTIYPNPVNSEQNFVYLTSKLNTTKHIEIYNVLGKKIFSISLSGKKLNISNLNKGVYLIKITENASSETRKLVIK